MVSIIKSDLPSGRVPYEGIPNASTKNAVMLLNNNILSLKKQLETLQSAVVELQRK